MTQTVEIVGPKFEELLWAFSTIAKAFEKSTRLTEQRMKEDKIEFEKMKNEIIEMKKTMKKMEKEMLRII